MFLAEPLIPLIFGEGWIGVSSMLHYLIPFSCGVTILHVYRAQMYSRQCFVQFLFYGRGMQVMVFSFGFVALVLNIIDQRGFLLFYALGFLLAGVSAGIFNYAYLIRQENNVSP